jgi:hypothetical protein
MGTSLPPLVVPTVSRARAGSLAAADVLTSLAGVGGMAAAAVAAAAEAADAEAVAAAGSCGLTAGGVEDEDMGEAGAQPGSGEASDPEELLLPFVDQAG